MTAPVLGLLAASSARLVYTLATLLVLVGIAMVVLTIWLVRSTRPDPEVLTRLEVMGTRRWRRSGTVARELQLNEVRATSGVADVRATAHDDERDDTDETDEAVEALGAATTAGDEVSADNAEGADDADVDADVDASGDVADVDTEAAVDDDRLPSDDEAADEREDEEATADRGIELVDEDEDATTPIVAGTGDQPDNSGDPDHDDHAEDDIAAVAGDTTPSKGLRRGATDTAQ